MIYDLSISMGGAGFYLNATNEKWKNWRMYDYVVKELPKVLGDNFEQLNTSCASIFGHSIGGHGALTIYLKNTDKYKGEDDKFLAEQLLAGNFEEACKCAGVPLNLRMQLGYDHSFFIATFIDDHIAHHVQFLKIACLLSGQPPVVSGAIGRIAASPPYASLLHSVLSALSVDVWMHCTVG